MSIKLYWPLADVCRSNGTSRRLHPYALLSDVTHMEVMDIAVSSSDGNRDGKRERSDGTGEEQERHGEEQGLGKRS